MAWDMAAETALPMRERSNPARIPYAGHFLHGGSIGNSQMRLRIPDEVSRFRPVPLGELSAIAVGCNWSVLEVAPGVYNFDVMRAWLDECQARKFYMGVNLLYKHFNLPARAENQQGDVIPKWHVDAGGQTLSGDHRGFIACIWQSSIEQAYKNLITALYKEFADHPYFIGIEIPETAGVDTSANPVRWVNASPWYADVAGYTGTGYTHLAYERAYGRIMNHAATLRPDMLCYGTPNLWPRGPSDADHITGWTNCFNECTVSENLICGGPDILCNSSTNLRNSYKRYYTNDTPYFYHNKRCSMQYDSAELAANGNHTIHDLWRIGRDKLGLKVVQWNYYTMSNTAGRAFNHNDVLAAIAGTTPITRYQGGNWSTMCVGGALS